MNPKNIFIGIVFVVVLYLVINWFLADKEKMEETGPWPLDGKEDIDKDILNDELVTDFSYSLWVYVKSWGGQSTILKHPTTNGNDREIQITATNKLSITLPPSTPVELNHFPLQRWVHIVATVHSGHLDVYLDGKLEKNTLVSGTLNGNKAEGLTLGDNNNSSKGYISRFSYFKKGLNPREVMDEYKKGPEPQGFLGGLFSKYKMKFQFLRASDVISEVSI